MTEDSRSPLRRVARSATAPVRGYLNNHFEMVKQEVRQHQPAIDDSLGVWYRLHELENTFAESSLYQAKILVDLRDQVAALVDRVHEIEIAVNRLSDVVSAMTISADRPVE